ncbi:methionine ABC transporter ATP-binding protein [Nesterenkonia marinintestina]|uniref:methionine ABC transporter ATP-binding protein n=1 Tax=Nesterenkonia marinintestina TaxID=2979865 RepID=UPI0021C0AF45|nr:ATP-binding cassette domain-containing protein [Nesterenkonia sp. GX14115]
MISLRRVSTTFPGSRGRPPVTAVDDVSLDVARGRIQGIIGFSGAGKSTLLRNINLLERPSAGTVEVGDVRLTDLEAEELRRARHQIGMIFQGFHLVNNLTVAQNVELALKFAGVRDRRVRRRRASEVLEVVDLAAKSTEYPARLSGGQKQRVAIARALAPDPQVLLCDEPTSALDPFTTASVLQYLADANREFGITVVLVTHEMEVIKALSDDVAVMEDGRVVERFAASDLTSGSFEPTTSIGRYLVGDGIRVERGAASDVDVETLLRRTDEPSADGTLAEVRG